MSDDAAGGSSKRLRRSNPSSGSNGNDGDSGGEDDDGKVTKGTWCKEEDDRLLDAVKKYGTDNWKAVSQVVTGRSAKQCRDRYKLKLDPHINHGPWTKAEDDRLLELAQEYGRAWTKIAKHMPGRTENAVKSRISSLERSRTKDWSPEEDAILVDLKKNNVDFEQMVQHFPNRSVHAIKKRWETLHMDELARKLRQDITSSSGAGGSGVANNGASSGNNGASNSSSLAEVPIPSSSSTNAMAPQSVPSYQPQQPPLMSSAALPQQMAPAFPMMMPFNGGGVQMPSVQSNKFAPGFPAFQAPSALPPAGGRLNRYSTSMTVLLQVLGNNAVGSPGRLTRENTSFTLPSNDVIATGNETETPRDQLLKALGFHSDQKE